MDHSVTKANTIPPDLVGKIEGLNARAWEVHITDPQLGLELSTEAKKLSEKYSYQEGIAYALRNMGVSYRYLADLETALSLSLQALEMFKQLEDKNGEAQSYVSIGALYYYTGDYDRNLDYSLKGLRLSEEIGNKQALAYAYNSAGYAYGMLLGDCKKGIELLKKALELTSEPGISPDLRPRVLEGLANIYLKDGQVNKAYEAAFESLHISEASSQWVPKADALFGLGAIYLSENRLDESKEYFLKGLILSRQVNHKVGEAYSLLYLGIIFIRQKDDEQAKIYLLDALEQAERIKAKAVIYQVHQTLAELYEIKQDINLFVKHYQLYYQYKTEVFKEEQENRQKYQAIQFEMEKLQQEAEISRLTNVVMKEANEELERKTVELEQSYNTVSVLSAIGKEITSTLNLDTILNTVYEKVNELMDASIFGIGIYKPDEGSIEYRLSIENGKRYQPYHRMMNDKTQLAVWCIEYNQEVFINDVEKEFSHYLRNTDSTSLKAASILATLEDGSVPQNPNSLIYLPLQVKDRTIGLISVQTYKKNAYTNHHLDILKTLASYTSAALYNAQSFETLQNTLNTLKLTQQQLVQSEKMASLGELTAGIAHEIQNPLNFVNNFSDVNRELVDELQQELRAGNVDEAIAVSNDIKVNEEKINHHGKRADAIVKGMLQHSLTSSGSKEPTDINALADEYLRLAYHGLRSKDKSFNATMKTDFDQSIGLINIIPQDIGRVILNLITNAFYALSAKSLTTADSGFDPTVSISTKKINGRRSDPVGKGRVEIKVKDNGNGIPLKVLDKIFQPFFTTKPTGQGTGLGLSLSYDIIKAHGGELTVETKEGEGAEFIIQLPVTSNEHTFK